MILIILAPRKSYPDEHLSVHTHIFLGFQVTHVDIFGLESRILFNAIFCHIITKAKSQLSQLRLVEEI